MKVFAKSFTQQEPIPEAGIQAAVEVMRSGRLHRYNTAPGEMSETDRLERDFADYLGVPYCLGLRLWRLCVAYRPACAGC